MSELLQIIVGFGSMAGVAALVSILVDLFKRFNLVADGEAPRWSAALNLIFLAIFVTLHYVAPQFGVELVDQQAGLVAQVMAVLLSLVMQLNVSARVHNGGMEQNSVLAFSQSERDF